MIINCLYCMDIIITLLLAWTTSIDNPRLFLKNRDEYNDIAVITPLFVDSQILGKSYDFLKKKYPIYFEVNPDIASSHITRKSSGLNVAIDNSWTNDQIRIVETAYPFVNLVRSKNGVSIKQIPTGQRSNWVKFTETISLSQDALNDTYVVMHEFGHVLGLPDCYIEAKFEIGNNKAEHIDFIITRDYMCGFYHAPVIPQYRAQQLKKHYGVK